MNSALLSKFANQTWASISFAKYLNTSLHPLTLKNVLQQLWCCLIYFNNVGKADIPFLRLLQDAIGARLRLVKYLTLQNERCQRFKPAWKHSHLPWNMTLNPKLWEPSRSYRRARTQNTFRGTYTTATTYFKTLTRQGNKFQGLVLDEEIKLW